MARPTAEEGASRQATAKEQQLSEMRRARRDADDAHQAMLNRISFLRSEEAKLDRDIDVAKRRALELLSRKAEKAEKVQDAELAATAKDILEVVGPTVQTGKGPLRPTTGRSSLRTSVAALLSTAPMAASAQALGVLSKGALTGVPTTVRSASAQRATRTGQPLKPTKPSLSSPTPLSSKRPPAALSAEGAAASPCATMAAAASTSGRAALGTPAKLGSRPESREAADTEGAAPGKPPISPAKGIALAAMGASTTGSSGRDKAQPLPPSGRAVGAGEAGMQQLDAGGGGEDASATWLFRQISQQQQQRTGGTNRMNTLGSGRRTEDTDPELIEELIAGTAAATAATAAQPQLVGLQQFSGEGATRVVHVKSTSKSKPKDAAAATSGAAGLGGGASAAVLAAGIGWGLPSAAPAGVGGALGSGGGVAGHMDAAEQARLQQELVKKRKLRGVRKAFGLQPTPLQDSSAQVMELGAGSWQ